MESIVKNGLEFLQREERRIQKLLEAKVKINYMQTR